MSLRDVSVEQLDLLDGVELRRARHVVTENQRVLDCAAALRAGDVAHAGELMAASHASLRDDYEVSIAELDRLVDIAAATPGVYGARLTGAGFGGCAVALVEAEAASAAARRIIADYGGHGRSWVCTPAAGRARSGDPVAPPVSAGADAVGGADVRADGAGADTPVTGVDPHVGPVPLGELLPMAAPRRPPRPSSATP